jgi:hypothetical protein
MAERYFDAQSPVNFSRIKAIFGNLNNLGECMSNFKEGLIIDKHFLENAYLLSDWTLIKDIAHRIRGGAVYFGAVCVEAACRELEYSLLGLNHENKESLYHEAINAIRVLEDYLNCYLSSKVD